MKWILIDNLMPNEPVLLNLQNITDIRWAHGTLTIGYVDCTKDEYECDKSVFIDIASSVELVKEIE